MKHIRIPTPRSVWGWLAFFSPAVVMIVCGMLIPAFINAARRQTDSWEISKSISTEMAWGTYGILMAGAISLALGYWLVPKEEMSFYKRCMLTCAHAVVVGYINVFVAFGGCMLSGIGINALSR